MNSLAQMVTTMTFDWGVIATAFAPTFSIFATAFVAWGVWRRTKKAEKAERAEKDAEYRRDRAQIAATTAKTAEDILKQGNATHVLVNDQLTREKASRLVELRAHRAVLNKLLGSNGQTKENEELLASMDAQITALADEIKQRDAAAGTLVPDGASKAK